MLPDILRYDRSQPAAYPNGRAITDDTFSARFAWMIGRQDRPPHGLKPHDDLLTEFPYLGSAQRLPGLNSGPAASGRRNRRSADRKGAATVR